MLEDDSGLLVSNQLVGNDQPIQGIIHRGQVALVRLERNQTWPDWCEVIKALAKGREICRQASGDQDKGRRFNKAMGRWLRCYGFDRIDKSDRSRLLKCADHLEDINTWRSGRSLSEQLELNHSSNCLPTLAAHPREGRGHPGAKRRPGAEDTVRLYRRGVDRQAKD
jgi:hypothetical protein